MGIATWVLWTLVGVGVVNSVVAYCILLRNALVPEGEQVPERQTRRHYKINKYFEPVELECLISQE